MNAQISLLNWPAIIILRLGLKKLWLICMQHKQHKQFREVVKIFAFVLCKITKAEPAKDTKNSFWNVSLRQKDVLLLNGGLQDVQSEVLWSQTASMFSSHPPSVSHRLWAAHYDKLSLCRPYKTCWCLWTLKCFKNIQFTMIFFHTAKFDIAQSTHTSHRQVNLDTEPSIWRLNLGSWDWTLLNV